jgi:hypothetical protein
MRIVRTSAVLVLVAMAATVISAAAGRALAENDCPKEKRKVCIQETLGGHTIKHPAYTNECLAAKFGGKVLNDGDCPH